MLVRLVQSELRFLNGLFCSVRRKVHQVNNSVLSEDSVDGRFDGLEDDWRSAIESLVCSIVRIHHLKRGITSLIGSLAMLELGLLSLIRFLLVIFIHS